MQTAKTAAKRYKGNGALERELPAGDLLWQLRAVFYEVWILPYHLARAYAMNLYKGFCVRR